METRHGDRYPAKSGARSARVIMNHAPSGSEPNERRGCDALLPYFIPRGQSLTVLGSDADGNPFNRTYEGKAPF
ncbi:DddA-like double-stranded DNA deaminase toxin [Actinokineospora sp.]|uniref:DddA-like double-stranded DNA deaminase toxin n=1 Tax=Actinokineospora sp. TaxID=1872133 RepID=UPI0040378081